MEYWKHLPIRHNLDVMHIEKDVCESIVNTLLNVPGKTKDGVASRRDMLLLGIREELAPKEKWNRTCLPTSSFTLMRKERQKFCQTLADIKAPKGYAAKIRSYVSMDVLMQHSLLVSIESILPEGLRNALIRIFGFFNILCSKVVDVPILQLLKVT